MLKIQKSANGRVVFTLSGRIEAEDVEELRRAALTEVLPSERAFFMTKPIQSVPSSQGAK